MRDALRYEWTRIRTLRSTYWLLGLALGLTAGIAFLVAFVTRDEPVGVAVIAPVLTGGGDFATFIPTLVAILGIFATGHEYRYGLIQPTLTALPRRSKLLVAKILVVSTVSMALVALSLAVNLGIGAIFWGRAPDLTAAPLDEVIPGYFVMVLLYAVLGLALAQLFRSVPAALVIIFIVPLVVEQLVIGLSFIPALDWLRGVVRFLPFTAGQRLIAMGDFNAGPVAPDFAMFGRWGGGAVFATWVLVVLTVAWYRLEKRDA